MAAANSIARWLFNEASSGTTPTTVADDTGNGNSLAIDYSSGDAVWASIAAGNGLNFLAAPNTANSAVLSIPNITTTGNIASSLSGATEFCYTIVADFTTPSSGAGWLFRLGPAENVSEVTYLVVGTDRHPEIRLYTTTGAQSAFFSTAIGSGVRVITVRVDTSQATQSNRVKITDNGVLLTPDYTEIGLNSALASLSGLTLAVGNRPVGDGNIQGSIYYAELFTGYLTDQQITDQSSALLANNDANWAAPPTLAFVGSATIDQITATTLRANVTTNLAATADILITSAGSSQPSDAAFDGASYTGSTVAYTVFQRTATSLSPSTNYRIWIRADNGNTKVYTSVDASTIAASSNIVSINGAQPIRYGQTDIVVIWSSGATGSTATTINGVTQGSHTVISDTETRFNLVWPNTLYGQTKTLTIGSQSATTPTFAPATGYNYVTLSGYNPSLTTGEIETSPAAVNGDQFVWNTEGGVVDITATGIPTFTATFDGTLSVAVVDQADGSHSSFATINYTPPLDIVPTQFDLGADTTNVNPSTAVTRTFTVAGVAAATDINFVATGAATVSSDGTNFFSSVNVQLGGTVYVRVTSSSNYLTAVTGGVSANGIADSFTVTTRAAAVPTITAQPSAQNVTAGQVASFILSATGATAYQWFEETGTTDTQIAGATSSTYARTTVLGDNGKSFYCRVTSSEGGIVYSNTVGLTVNPANVTITSQVMRDASTKQIRASVSNIPVRIRRADGTIALSTTVNTNGSGIWTLTNNTMGIAGETVYVEFPDSGSGSYTGFSYVLT